MSTNSEFEEVRVEIERDGKPVVVSFQGRSASRAAQISNGSETVYRAYTTPKGKIAVTKRSAVAWQASAHLGEDAWADVANGEEWWQPTYELFVADNWDELSKQLTPEVTAKLHDKAQPLPVEHLDI